MSRCKEYQTGRLDLELDEQVTRRDLMECIESGWSAEEVAEELELEGVAEVWRWCDYHEVKRPLDAQQIKAQAAAAAKDTRRERQLAKLAAAEAKRTDRIARALLRDAKAILERVRAQDEDVTVALMQAMERIASAEATGAMLDLKRRRTDPHNASLAAAAAKVPDELMRLELWDVVVWQLHDAGVSPREIATMTPLSFTQVMAALKREEIARDGHDNAAWRERRSNAAARAEHYTAAHVCAALERFHTLAATARVLGLSPHYVKMIANKEAR